MSRAHMTFACATLACAAVGALAFLAPDRAVAQVGCQPTIMQPCTNVPAPATNATPGQRKPVDAADDREPKDHSPRIQLDKDTEFKFGTGGIGLGRKF